MKRDTFKVKSVSPTLSNQREYRHKETVFQTFFYKY